MKNSIVDLRQNEIDNIAGGWTESIPGPLLEVLKAIGAASFMIAGVLAAIGIIKLLSKDKGL